MRVHRYGRVLTGEECCVRILGMLQDSDGRDPQRENGVVHFQLSPGLSGDQVGTVLARGAEQDLRVVQRQNPSEAFLRSRFRFLYRVNCQGMVGQRLCSFHLSSVFSRPNAIASIVVPSLCFGFCKKFQGFLRRPRT